MKPRRRVQPQGVGVQALACYACHCFLQRVLAIESDERTQEITLTPIATSKGISEKALASQWHPTFVSANPPLIVALLGDEVDNHLLNVLETVTREISRLHPESFR